MCRMPFLTPKPLVKYKSGVAGHIMPPHTCNDLTSHAFIADHAPTLDYVQRSCSSLYRLPRFINCPTYITLQPPTKFEVGRRHTFGFSLDDPVTNPGY